MKPAKWFHPGVAEPEEIGRRYGDRAVNGEDGDFILIARRPVSASTRRLGDRLSLLGMRDHVLAQRAVAHIFVLASQFDGLPMAVIEAMFSPLPLVACTVRGPAEQVV